MNELHGKKNLGPVLMKDVDKWEELKSPGWLEHLEICNIGRLVLKCSFPFCALFIKNNEKSSLVSVLSCGML